MLGAEWRARCCRLRVRRGYGAQGEKVDESAAEGREQAGGGELAEVVCITGRGGTTTAAAVLLAGALAIAGAASCRTACARWPSRATRPPRRTSAGATTSGRACRRTTPRPPAGPGWRPSRATRRRSTASAFSTSGAAASPATTRRRRGGTGPAAEQGYPPAQAALSSLYVYGAGVDRDPVLAAMWMELAWQASVGAPDWRLYAGQRAELASAITAEQMAEGRRLAREWTPAPER